MRRNVTSKRLGCGVHPNILTVSHRRVFGDALHETIVKTNRVAVLFVACNRSFETFDVRFSDGHFFIHVSFLFGFT